MAPSKKRWPQTYALALGFFLLGLLSGLCSCAGPAPPQAGAPEKIYCLWLLWTKDPKLADKAKSRLAQGEPFTMAARDLAKQDKEKISLNSHCLPASKLAPQVLAQARGLEMGQVSEPFALAEGTAWVMLTTDQHRRQARSFYEKGQYEKAEKELRADLKLHPASAPSWHLTALCRSARQDYAGALEALDKALRFAPQDLNLRQDKATTLAYLNRAGEAIPLYEQVLAADPQNALALSNLAWALALERRDLAKAQSLAKKALEMAPQNARFWNVLGLVQQAQGDHPAALVSFHRAARLDPALPQVKENLVKSLLALNSQEVGRLLRPRPEKTGAAAKPEVKPTSLAAGPKTAPRRETRPAAQAPPEVAARAAPAPRPASGVSAAGQIPAPPWQAPAPAPAPPAAKPGPAQLIFLQVGSHRSPELTRREIGCLRDQGHKPFIKEWKDNKGRVWLRVILGPYPSAAKAVEVGRELRRQKIIVSYKVLLRKQAWADTPAAGDAAPGPGKAPQRPGPAPAQPSPARGQAPAGPRPGGPGKSDGGSGKTERPASRLAAYLQKPGAERGAECYLVVGSYPDRDQAQMIRQSWLLKGYAASLRTWPQGEKGIWHRVLLGPYASRGQALAAADRLKQTGLLGSYLLVETIADPVSPPGRP